MEGRLGFRNDKKANEYGEKCVYLFYTTQGVTVKKSSEIWIHPEHWLGDKTNSNKYILGGRNGNLKADLLNQKLYNFKKKYDKQIEEVLKDSKTVLTVPTLRSILNDSYEVKKEIENGKVSFTVFLTELVNDLYGNEKISYSLKSNNMSQINQFKKFLTQVKRMDPKKFYCKDLTTQLISEFIIWKKSNCCTNETINHNLTPIFKGVKKMIRLGWIERTNGEEILGLSLPTCKRDLGDMRTDKHYLTKNQIKDFIKIVEKSKYPRTKEIADMYMFSLQTGGLRFSDILTLKWDEIDWDNGIINHLQVKNHTRKPTYLTVPITDEGTRILKKWQGRNEVFVFDMLSEDIDLSNEKLVRHYTNTLNRTVNQSLRNIGEKMKLGWNLTFHSSRHTWATLALNNKVDLNIISNIMGHSSPYVTGKVYSKYLPKTLSKEVNKKLNFKFNK